MILLEPEESIGNEEVSHLVATVVENQRPPFPMLSKPRILMLVEGGAVEAGEPVGILGKMTRHPVKNDADAGLMQAVDQKTEFIGRSEPAAGRKEIHHLITPGTIEGMLHHRQKLDMGEAHLLHIGHQFHRQLQVAEGPVVIIGFASP